jgi:chromosome segregation ATPase
LRKTLQLGEILLKEEMDVQVLTISRKAELKERIKSLQTERSNLETEISQLKEKVEIKDLEAYTQSLENEVGTLKVEKTVLEERVNLSMPYNVLGEEANILPAISSVEKPIQTDETPGRADDIVQPITNES